MNKPFLEIKSDSFRLSGFELQPLEGFEFPKSKKGVEFPYCCKFHSEVLSGAKKWFDKFPNCCELHKEFAKMVWFDKSIYNGIELKIVRQVVYTEHTIRLHIDSIDWFEAITEYIDAGVYAFGMPAVGQHLYLSALNDFLKGWTVTKLPVEKCNSLLQYINESYNSSNEKDLNNETDLNLLYATYAKWLSIFPFEISFFSNLKNNFENKLPFINGEVKRNRYTGIATGKSHTKDTLVLELVKVTNKLLTTINVASLYKSGKLTETKKLQLELIVKSREHKINKVGYNNNSTNGERRFHRMIRAWFEDEKRFIAELIPIVGNLDTPEEKPDLLLSGLHEYGFFELSKVRELASYKIKDLVDLIRKNSIPYKIAMFEYLGFIELIDKRLNRIITKRNRVISKWFNSDKNGRTVKGNISSLFAKSNEDKERYTAHLHKQTVEKDYQNLK